MSNITLMLRDENGNELGEKTVTVRLTKRHLVNARVNHAVDLSVMDFGNPENVKHSLAMKFVSDPIFTIECFWAFFEQDLTKLGFTEDSFNDAVTDDKIVELKGKFIPACAAFFPLVATLYTAMQAMSPGSQNFQKVMDQAAAQATALANQNAQPTQ